MTIHYPHTHDRETCADCARQRELWGPTDHCGRVHELREGDRVRIRGGKAIWRVESCYPTTIGLSRPRRNPRSITGMSRTRLVFADRPGGGVSGPITDLIPVPGHPRTWPGP
jgi:hypothetical protein